MTPSRQPRTPTALSTVFSPITVGTLELDRRVVVPPHGGGNSKLIGAEAEFEQLCEMWRRKAAGGMQWLGGPAVFVANPMPPGFEPSGVGAHGPGFFRADSFRDRMRRFVDVLHAEGAVVSCQMVQQGGMPTGPSPTFSGHLNHSIAHALDAHEVRWLIDEFVWSAGEALASGVDAIEIHANHDDVVQWFLSPATNQRTDGYGGSFDNRRRFLREICDGIRAAAGRPFTFGLRLNLDERIEGGYDAEGCAQIVEAFTADGTLDYFSFDIGGNWDDPSYIQIPWYPDMAWAELCGEVRRSTDLPVVYAGRVSTMEQAEAVLAAGHADLVGMARATMADPEIVAKTLEPDGASATPCIGLNECINRRLTEGLSHACGVNPRFGREATVAHPTPVTVGAGRGLRVGIVGAGPAGLELAGLLAEGGAEPVVWDRNAAVGGTLRVASLARGNHTYPRWLEHQRGRLDRLGVDLRLGVEVDADLILGEGLDAIVAATGATPRRPPIPGVDGPGVFTVAEALRSTPEGGSHIVVVVEDDGPAPLSTTHELASRGHRCTLVHQSPEPAPLVGRYSKGGMLAMLIDAGVEFVPMARVTGIDLPNRRVEVASTFGRRRWHLDGVDSVVLACGAIGDDRLHRQLRERPMGETTLHLLGDAFAPRRVVHATRQAFALAEILLDRQRAR